MSGASVAKKPASVLRTYTQQVRDHTAGMQRAQDQYFAGLKRLEAQYFDTVRRMTEALTQETAPASPNAAAPAAEGETAA